MLLEELEIVAELLDDTGFVEELLEETGFVEELLEEIGFVEELLVVPELVVELLDETDVSDVLLEVSSLVRELSSVLSEVLSLVEELSGALSDVSGAALDGTEELSPEPSLNTVPPPAEVSVLSAELSGRLSEEIPLTTGAFARSAHPAKQDMQTAADIQAVKNFLTFIMTDLS